MKKLFWQISGLIILIAAAAAISLPIAADSTLPKISKLWRPLHLGWDLQGGAEITYRADLKKVSPRDRDSVMSGIVGVLEKRINALGVAESNIYKSGDNIVIELPGVADTEEAKARIGKVVELEFKEQGTTYSAEKLKEINQKNKELKDNAQQALGKALEPGADFERVKQEFSDNFSESQFTELDSLPYSQDIKDKLLTMEVGEIYPSVVDNFDQYEVVKILDKKKEQKEETLPEEVKAQHILIAYQESERADPTVTRSKEEAQKRAEEVLQKTKSGADWNSLAKEYTDEAAGKETGGDLGWFKKGQMTKNFEDAVFAMDPGKISDSVVETEFGYHIIKLNEKKAESTEPKTVTSLKLDIIKMEKVPEVPKDGWIETGLSGKQFKKAQVQFDEYGNPQVGINFNTEGAELFAAITKRNLKKPVAIFLDNGLLSAPTVQSEITDGNAVITGDFDYKQASDLARDLNTGAIPAPIYEIASRKVEAALGANSFQRGIQAGLIGLLVLMIYVAIYYRLPGLLADISLLSYALLAIALFKLINVNMSLAGIAGFILSIGMAIDANVLIFERLKEELQAERPLAQAIEIAFQRSWPSIRESNLSTIFTCIVLFFVGGIIRGFAVTLLTGILCSMFAAMIITHVLLKVFLVHSSLGKKPSLYNINRRKPNQQEND